MFEFLLVGRPYNGFPANIIAQTAFDAGLFRLFQCAENQGEAARRQTSLTGSISTLKS